MNFRGTFHKLQVFKVEIEYGCAISLDAAVLLLFSVIKTVLLKTGLFVPKLTESKYNCNRLVLRLFSNERKKCKLKLDYYLSQETYPEPNKAIFKFFSIHIYDITITGKTCFDNYFDLKNCVGMLPLAMSSP